MPATAPFAATSVDQLDERARRLIDSAQPGEIAGALEPAATGWRRASVWQEQPGGAYGDEQLGVAFVAFYDKAGSDMRAQVAVYACATGGPNGTDTDAGRYVLEERTVTYRQAPCEDGDVRDELVDYRDASPLYFDTVEDAEREALELALRDQADDFDG